MTTRNLSDSCQAGGPGGYLGDAAVPSEVVEVAVHIPSVHAHTIQARRSTRHHLSGSSITYSIVGGYAPPKLDLRVIWGIVWRTVIPIIRGLEQNRLVREGPGIAIPNVKSKAIARNK